MPSPTCASLPTCLPQAKAVEAAERQLQQERERVQQGRQQKGGKEQLQQQQGQHKGPQARPPGAKGLERKLDSVLRGVLRKVGGRRPSVMGPLHGSCAWYSLYPSWCYPLPPPHTTARTRAPGPHHPRPTSLDSALSAAQDSKGRAPLNYMSPLERGPGEADEQQLLLRRQQRQQREEQHRLRCQRRREQQRQQPGPPPFGPPVSGLFPTREAHQQQMEHRQVRAGAGGLACGGGLPGCMPCLRSALPAHTHFRRRLWGPSSCLGPVFCALWVLGSGFLELWVLGVWTPNCLPTGSGQAPAH